MRRARLVSVLLALCAWPALAPPPRVAAEEPAPTPIEALLASVAPAVVEVRFTLTATFTLGGRSGVKRIERTANGTVVDASGLVMMSDSLTGGPRSPLIAMYARHYPGIEYTIEIEDVRVTLGEGAEELPAVLVLRDSRNDLAWFQILDLGERRLPAVDLETGRDARVGEEFATVGRLGRGFGFAACCVKGRIASVAERPRRLWVFATGGAAGQGGMLFFAPTGVPLAFLAFLPPPEGAREPIALRLLPLDVVRKSRDAARSRVAEVVAKARAAQEPDSR